MAVLLYRRPALERGNIVLFSSWLRYAKRSALTAGRRTQAPPRQQASFRPRLEALEDRCLPSTLTVTNTQDSGRGSLRAEIAAAQSGDTIVFSPTLTGASSSKPHHGGTTSTPGKITLTSGELDLTKNLTIQGPGAGQLTISGYGGQTFTRVFEVAPNTTVTLSGLNIINGSGYASAQNPGYAPWDGYGGGILNLGTLTLSACTIDYNSALNGGGGIYSDGTLTVSGCTVYGNRAADGAGIATSGTATLVNSTISNNNASDTSPGSYQPDGAGGGISNGGTLTLSGCTVSGNYANWEGGGIFNGTSGKVTVENSSTITGNNPDDVWNFGVLYLDSTSTISTLDGNPAIPI
jgi:predicted outer membrane repeat protein